MNCWTFANNNPVAACILGFGLFASAAVIAYIYADKGTPIIGSVSPNINISLGNLGVNDRSETEGRIQMFSNY